MHDHQTVWITGSSRGLGFETAKILNARGFQVILTGRKKEHLDQAIHQLNPASQPIALEGDLTDPDILQAIIMKIRETVGVPEVIIHTLGGKIAEDQHPLTESLLARSLRLNLGVAAEINRAFLPDMVKKGSGNIIHVSSDASLSGAAAPGYSAAKAAVNAYVKSTARFYVKHGISICAVLPGVFEHEGSAWSQKKVTDPAYYAQKISQMPLGRFGQVEEIAAVLAELAATPNVMRSGSLIELTGAA